MSIIAAADQLLPHVVRVETPEQRNDLADLVAEYTITWSGNQSDALSSRDDQLIEAIRSDEVPNLIAGFVTYVGDVPVGSVLLRRFPQLVAAVEVDKLFVLPEYRRRGASTLLLETAHNYAISSGRYSMFYLFVRSSRHAALNLYEKLGYTVYHRFPRDGFTEMILPINGFESMSNDILAGWAPPSLLDDQHSI